MLKHKLKVFLFLMLIAFIYALLQIYVLSTPSTNDDQMPEKFLQSAVIYAVEGDQ
jgi:hypothetical protein